MSPPCPLRKPLRPPRLILSFSQKPLTASLRLMPLDKPYRRRQETKLLAHTVLEVTHEREMEAGFSARSENDEGRRANAYLRDVLHMQARAAMRPGRHDTRPMGDLPFKE